MDKFKENTLPEFLLSIVIATRNRIPYAISAIESILAISDHRLQLVVQDNSDSNELESYVSKHLSNCRFKYCYIPTILSSIGNFNGALELATGEYVCLIGDDDGINPEIIDAAAWAKRENIDSLGGRSMVYYLWAGANAPSTVFTEVTGEVLTIGEFEEKIEEVDVEKELKGLMRNGGAYYLNFRLPKLYHGLVKRSCLDEIREKTGNYLAGLSPDIYAAITIACVAKRVAITNYPLTIPGACGVSSSVVEGSIKKHSKKLENAPHLRGRDNYQWCNLIPRLYSVETIWAESGTVALRAMGRDDLLDILNLPKLAAFCISRNKDVYRMVFPGLIEGLRNSEKSIAYGLVAFVFGFITGPLWALVKRLWNRMLIMMGKRRNHKISNLRDMVSTSEALALYLRETNNSFINCQHFYSNKKIL